MTAGGDRLGPGQAGRLVGAGEGRPGPARPAVAAAWLAAWTLFLAGSVALLHAVGGALAPPPLTGPGALGRWFDGRQPVEATFAVVRLLALGLAWYLLAATVVGTAARLVGAPSVARAADVVTVALVRRLVNGAVGVSLATVALTGAGGTALADEAAGPPGAPVEAMQLLPDPAAGSPVPTMQRLPDQPSAETVATTPPPPPPPPTPPDDAPPGSAAPGTAAPDGAEPITPGAQAGAAAGRTWPVQPGEHFWAVAEKVLAESWSRPPADDEVDPYWRALVDANRSMLRDPANPDLLFPGQVIVVPPPPEPPA